MNCLKKGVIFLGPRLGVGSSPVLMGASVVDDAPYEIEPIEAPFSMPQFSRPVFPDRRFDIRDFSAIEDGEVLNTVAIRKTVEAYAEAEGGKRGIESGRDRLRNGVSRDSVTIR